MARWSDFLNEGLDWREKDKYWYGVVQLEDETTVEIMIDGESKQHPGPVAFEEVGEVMDEIERSDSRFRNEILRSLYDVHKDWSDDDPPELSANEFRERFQLGLISRDDVGVIDLWYNDAQEDTANELFAGRPVVMRIEPGGELGKAHLAG